LFRVQSKPVDGKAFQPWVDKIHSADLMGRAEAARVLASVAPHSLENLLLTFANDPVLQQYAPLALHRLNTPRSIAALKSLSENSKASQFAQQRASSYLANDSCSIDY
jgi:hypothetical protein